MPETIEDRKPIQFKTTARDRRNLDVIRDGLARRDGCPATRADAFRLALEHFVREFEPSEKISRKSKNPGLTR